MRAVVFSDDAAGPVARHRYRAMAAPLRDAGFGEVRFTDIPKGVRARAAAFRGAADADLVLLSRKLFTRFELALLRRAARRLVFDFDDAVCFRDSTRGRPKSHVRARRFRRTVREADLVTAGNAYLAELARKAGARQVVVAPTAVDTTRYTPGPAASRSAFRVGWIGSRSTRAYLSLVAAPLAEVARRVPECVVAVMADQPPRELDGLPVEFTPWSEHGEAAFLRSLHAGLMPLPDDPWTRGKCGFKLLQYMACGVPALASPVGVNPDIVAQGAAGRLCRDDAAWVAALSELAADPATAAALGARGRAEAEARWSVARLGPAFAAALAGAAKG
jgi:glycosyltransferase involved in cell wall biosynthesis